MLQNQCHISILRVWFGHRWCSQPSSMASIGHCKIWLQQFCLWYHRVWRRRLPKKCPKIWPFCVGHAPATSPDFSGLNKPPQASRFRFFGFLIIYEWVCQICKGHCGPATLALMVILCPVPMMTQTGERINHLNHCPDHGRTLLFKESMAVC